MTLSAQATAFLREAIEHRRAQRMAQAANALVRAEKLAPDDRDIVFLTAQLAYERGYPAADLFARAQALWPDNPDIVRNRALALASEGKGKEASDLLAEELGRRPGWIDGQRVLASLRWTSGDNANFDAGWAEAVAQEPDNTALWLGWFAGVMQVRDWTRAAAVIDQAESRVGAIRQLRVARAVLAAEAQDDEEARRAFADLEGVDDDALALARLRFLLRTGDPRQAEAVALGLLASPVARQAWPYLSLIWRLLGDSRAQWLDGSPLHCAELDPGFSASELSDLAQALRSLHIARQSYADQTVRGGTQTDRSVLLRHEPIFENARAKLMAALREFVDRLPPPDPPHPLLGLPRASLAIAGSWSVRIGTGGRNVPHSHPCGWISSAFYVALPDDGEAGEPPPGHLRLGVPPSELGLDLPPLATIAPSPGKLALFASTMWHDTVPILAGERLNIAFDVIPTGPV